VRLERYCVDYTKKRLTASVSNAAFWALV